MSADRLAIRVLSVDDHPIVREGLAALLANQPDMTLVAEASNVAKQSSSSEFIVLM